MKIHLSLALILAGSLVGHAQGTFRNLNFEEANLPAVSHGFEPVEDALPGWTVIYGTNVETLISRNSYGFDGKSRVSIWEREVYPVPLAGRCFVDFLRYGLDLTPVSIAQTGIVPADSLSLRFLVTMTPWIAGDMSVQLNGTELQMQVLGFTGGATVVGADVSAFAGQTVELRLISHPYQDAGVSQTYLDNIMFSPEPVPEPATFVLLALGGALAATRWRVRSRKR
ncbi:MAG: PEP-CTERM sorting domain-containing protein [Verrucomicrobia bacterium]|nr:PEP-CTERM sorting domain-containing protein [Verrucomicrobiota bacterium]